MKAENWLALFCILVVAVVGFYANTMLQVGAGYSSKVVCSGTFTGGRDFDKVIKDDIGLPLPLYTFTKEGNTVIASSLFGLIKRRANYDPNRNSCTLAAPGETTTVWDAAEFNNEKPTKSSNNVQWPQGEQNAVEVNGNFNKENLDKLMDAAFHEPVMPETGIHRNTRAAVIVYDGKIIAERYAEGYSADTPLLGWSMTKSILSTLIGARIQENKMSLSANNLFKEWDNDERSEITLDQLLRASSGLEFRETNDPWSDTSGMLFRSGDYVQYASSKPLKHKPDTVWSYSSGTTNILAQLLRDSFKDDGGDVAYWNYANSFFKKLGMESMVMDTDASGTFVGSSFSHATPRDWARFGLFALQKGQWNGEQILPTSWFDYALTATPPAPRGEYGAQWWLNAGAKDNISNRPYPDLPTDAFFAQGYLGQTVAVIPSHKLVVVRLGATTPSSAWNLAGFLGYIVNQVISN